MAHPEQFEFVQKVKSNFSFYFAAKNVLEVGSLNINGSIRPMFLQCNYIGLDLDIGPGVDVVCAGQDFNAPDNTFDTVFSTECFEHNPHWEETFRNMIRMTKKSGLVFFTCATTGRKEHGTARTDFNSSPFTVAKGWNYYRNLTEQDFRKCFDFDKLFNYYGFEVNDQSFDLYFYGIRAADGQ